MSFATYLSSVPGAPIEKTGGFAAKLAVLCATPSVLAAVFDRQGLLQSYLFAWMVMLSLPMGALTFLMIHQLTGGRWGRAPVPLMQSAVATLPVVAIFFLPILMGMGELYEWAHPEALAHDAVLQHKAAYLNPAGFAVRSLTFLLLWSLLGVGLSSLIDRGDSPWAARWRARIAAPGLLFVVTSMTFASVDWVMSLEPHWFSTIYGLIWVVVQGLGGMAMITPTLTLLRQSVALREGASADHFHDLGNFLLMGVCLQAYVSFSQYLIIWSGNLPEEIVWYMNRTHGLWLGVALFLMLFHFAVPFLLLLWRANKRAPGRLAAIAVLILIGHPANVAWLVLPSFQREGVPVTIGDGLALGALLSVWTWRYCKSLHLRVEVKL